MPELPEVETVVRSLALHVTGRTIRRVEIYAPRIRRGRVEQAQGRRIAGVRRVGKFIVFDLEGGFLCVHLGMTGKLLLRSDSGDHTRARIQLDRGEIFFDDPRMFGNIEFSPQLPHRVSCLGQDPLEISFEEFRALLRLRRGALKALLLNQRFLRGVGNIYADEALFRARLHPLEKADRLNKVRAQRLYDALRQVLREAIARGGSSVSDYVDADGRRGWFQQLHCVYRRHGEPCPACGARIRRILVSQRGTHYCPRCQSQRRRAR